MTTFFRKLQNYFFHRLIARPVFQVSRDFYDKPTPRKKFALKLNQYLNEKGMQTPLIFTKAECLAFWQSLGNDSASSGNRPEAYAVKDTAIVDFLDAFWSPDVEKSHSILELGCNCGANLYRLHQLGYTKLNGIEINPAAVEQMHRSFPGFEKLAAVTLGSLDAVLGRMPDKSMDTLFTMGVAMHIHPKDNFVFSEMARVAKRHICTLEPEPENSNYVFSRNYARVFERLGCREIRAIRLTAAQQGGLKDYVGCTARLFRVP
jgi:SAM-dependent methyltransferase